MSEEVTGGRHPGSRLMLRRIKDGRAVRPYSTAPTKGWRWIWRPNGVKPARVPEFFLIQYMADATEAVQAIKTAQ